MPKRARTILVILFFIAFAITAPIIVLSTQGYRYDWKKMKLEKTGILRIVTSPSGATIFLNDAPTGQTTPASLFRLLPERYIVRLERPGVLPWERSLDVRSGETTFASGVRLITDSLPVLQTALTAESALFSPDGTRFAFVRDAGEWKEIGIGNVQGDETVLLARFGKDLYQDTVLQWSPSGTSLSVAAMRSGTPALTLYRTSPPYDAIAIHDAVSLRDARFHWTDNERAVVVFRDSPGPDAALILRVDPASRSSDGTLPRTGIRSYGDETETIDVHSETDLRIVTIDGLRQLRFADGTRMELPAQADRILRVTDGRALLAESTHDKMLLVNLPEKSIIGTYDTNRFSLPPRETGWRDLLLWNDYEILSVDVVSGNRWLITRIGTAIRDVHVLPGLPLIVYATDAGITLIEREDISGRTLYDLVRFDAVGGIGVDPRGPRILFLGAIGNQHGIYARGL